MNSFPKTDIRHWRDKLFQRSNDEWHCRIGFGGRQDRWPLRTANREQAAAKARDIWLSLQKDGFEATEAKFKPWTVAPVQSVESVTVGDYIKAAKAVAVVRPTTLTTYTRKFRFLVSQIHRFKGAKQKFNYFNGGSRKWQEKIDSLPLASITSDNIAEWRVRYISRFDSRPLKQASAKHTSASIIRNAKALFNPKLVKLIRLPLPSSLPFDDVHLEKRPKVRYKSKVDASALAIAAYSELKDAAPEQFKIFLLAFGAGLRRSEIDRLTFDCFDWKASTLSIEPNEYGLTKTEQSNDTIDIDNKLADYFKTSMASATSKFVIASKAAPSAAPHWNRYRCDGHFKALLAWLRTKGITARNPLHTLRKEFGSLINKEFGLFAASAALRHSSITVTREAYVDKKQRIALDISELMQGGK